MRKKNDTDKTTRRETEDIPSSRKVEHSPVAHARPMELMIGRLGRTLSFQPTKVHQQGLILK